MQMVISYITKTYRKTLKLEIYCGIYFADEERIMLPNLVLLLDSDFDCAKSLNTLIPKRFLGLGLGTFAPFCAILRSQTDKISHGRSWKSESTIVHGFELRSRSFRQVERIF